MRSKAVPNSHLANSEARGLLMEALSYTTWPLALGLAFILPQGLKGRSLFRYQYLTSLQRVLPVLAMKINSLCKKRFWFTFLSYYSFPSYLLSILRTDPTVSSMLGILCHNTTSSACCSVVGTEHRKFKNLMILHSADSVFSCCITMFVSILIPVQ